MKSLTKASRVNTAIQVIQYMNAGMSVVDPCREMGVPRCIIQNNVKVEQK